MPIYWGTPDGNVWKYGYDYGGRAFCLDLGEGVDIVLHEGGMGILINRRHITAMSW